MFETMFDNEELDQLVQIGGLIRFSLPTEGGFQKNPERNEDKLAKLYAPERMEQRFAYFEQYCLHTFKRQTDPNFSIGILVGESMPEPYRDRLDGLLVDLPQAKVIEKPIMSHRQAVRQAYDEIFDRQTPLRLWFRLDDDDALAVDYIEQVRAKIPQLLLMSGGLDPVCLTFSQGLTLLGPSGKRYFVADQERSPSSLGLAVLGPASLAPLVMMYHHMKIHTQMRTILDPIPMMSLRTLHESNDSRAILQPGIRFELTKSELTDMLAERFDLDIETVLAL